MRRATHGAQNAACNMQHATHGAQHAPRHMQHADAWHFVRRATCTAPHSTARDSRCTTRNMQPHMRSQAVAPPKSTTPVIPAADHAHARTHAQLQPQPQADAAAGMVRRHATAELTYIGAKEPILRSSRRVDLEDLHAPLLVGQPDLAVYLQPPRPALPTDGGHCNRRRKSDPERTEGQPPQHSADSRRPRRPPQTVRMRGSARGADARVHDRCETSAAHVLRAELWS
jgi:hypothetical protein